MAFAADPDSEAPTVASSFDIQTWSGDNDATRVIDGYNFEPSLAWIKWKTGSYGHSHILYTNLLNDPNANSGLSTNSTAALNSYKLTTFTDDGFQFASPINAVNETGFTFVGWTWKADDNEPTINTEGTIDTIVSANSNGGFSIVNWTGGSSSTATTGHGLSASPEFIIMRPVNATSEWYIYHKDLTSGNSLKFTTDAESTAVAFTVNSTLFYTNWTNTSYNWIAYCWHSVSGFSDIGTFTGTGTGTNQLITTGFQPDWVMFKDYSAGGSWFIVDSVRGGSKSLKANSTDGEATTNYITFESNGFRVAGDANATSDWVYAAFKIN